MRWSYIGKGLQKYIDRYSLAYKTRNRVMPGARQVISATLHPAVPERCAPIHAAPSGRQSTVSSLPDDMLVVQTQLDRDHVII